MAGSLRSGATQSCGCLNIERTRAASWRRKETSEHVLDQRRIKRLRREAGYRLKRQYGITLEQYDEMLEKQGGMCAICFVVMLKPHVDHNHKNKQVRKLLCDACNLLIGMAKENTEILRNAAKYLEEHFV